MNVALRLHRDRRQNSQRTAHSLGKAGVLSLLLKVREAETRVNGAANQPGGRT